MRLDDILGNPGEWLAVDGPHHRAVVSSRVRLARNLDRRPFPGWAKKNERVEILGQIRPEIEGAPSLGDVLCVEMGELSALDKQVLVERHLISREHASRAVGSAVLINRAATLSVMVNEEDHLRLQALQPGLQLEAAHALVAALDAELETHLDFAFDLEIGYLTACPTNVGTGMRASAMLHLPGLVLADLMGPVIHSVGKLGLVVRGIHGEGTEAMGNLFQISNQITLGKAEAVIIDDLKKVILHVVDREQNARGKLVEARPGMLCDQIGRAYGILCHARSISSKEALNLLSLLRLGVDLDIFPSPFQVELDTLFTVTQPAHLQRDSSRKLSTEQRDEARAGIIRARMGSCPPPEFDRLET